MSERRESERLLELAETQYERVRRAEDDERRALQPVRASLWAFGLTLLGVFVVGMLFVSEVTPMIATIFFGVVGGFGALCGVVGFRAMRVLSVQREQLSVEQHVLNEVLRLLRESEITFRTKEGWSVIDQAEFRIRLSRLPIGVDAKTLDFEFVSIRFPLLGSFELSKRASRRGRSPSEPPVLPPEAGANPSR